MDLDLQKIKTAFSLYSGEDLTEESSRAELCVRLCEECAAKVKQAAAPDIDETEDCSALESWAAAEAFYQLCLRDEAASPESITADGVRIDDRERSARAKALAAAKRWVAQPLLREEGFYFGSV